jgi:hypothetical protein
VRLGAADRRGDAEVQQKRRRHRLDAAVQTSPAGAAPAATAVAGAATAARNGDADRPPHAGCRADILALGARYRACVSSRLEAAGTRVFIAAEQALDAAARQSDAIVVVLAAAAQTPAARFSSSPRRPAAASPSCRCRTRGAGAGAGGVCCSGRSAPAPSRPPRRRAPRGGSSKTAAAAAGRADHPVGVRRPTAGLPRTTGPRSHWRGARCGGRKAAGSDGCVCGGVNRDEKNACNYKATSTPSPRALPCWLLDTAPRQLGPAGPPWRRRAHWWWVARGARRAPADPTSRRRAGRLWLNTKDRRRGRGVSQLWHRAQHGDRRQAAPPGPAGRPP